MKKIILLIFGFALVFVLPSLASAAINVPAQLSPSYGAKNYNAAVTNLYWTKLPDVTGYNLRFKGGDNNFSDPISLSVNYKLASQLGALNDGQTYYWQVQAKKGTEVGSWSQIFRFTTISLPAKAVLLSPLNSTISQDTAKDFSWRVYQNTLFSKVIIYGADQSSGLCGTDVKLSFQTKATKISSNILVTLNPEKYCWTVRSCGNIGCADEATKVKFTLAKSSMAPNLLYISTGFDSTIFYWEQFTDETAIIQVSKKENFMSGESTVELAGLDKNYLIVNDAPDAFKNFINNNKGINLYWRVGTNGNWSKSQRFTPAFLSKPILIYPANNTVNFTAPLAIFRWESVRGATFYKMEIGSDKVYYSSTNAYRMPANTTQGTFASSTSYTFKVTAYNNFTESLPSETFTFRTK